MCQLGFGNHNEHGSFIIPDNQLESIINFDETALLLLGRVQVLSGSKSRSFGQFVCLSTSF